MLTCRLPPAVTLLLLGGRR